MSTSRGRPMDEPTVRRQLAEVQAALDGIEQEREVLLSLARGYEGWLRLHGLNGQKPAKPSLQASAKRRITKGSVGRAVEQVVGELSYRRAVLDVLKEARGEPLHVKEILNRARAKGANTKAKDPVGITDLLLYSSEKQGQPVRKSGPRTWKWEGGTG